MRVSHVPGHVAVIEQDSCKMPLSLSQKTACEEREIMKGCAPPCLLEKNRCQNPQLENIV